jgi:hypothetical protein
LRKHSTSLGAMRSSTLLACYYWRGKLLSCMTDIQNTKAVANCTSEPSQGPQLQFSLFSFHILQVGFRLHQESADLDQLHKLVEVRCPYLFDISIFCAEWKMTCEAFQEAQASQGFPQLCCWRRRWDSNPHHNGDVTRNSSFLFLFSISREV